MMGSFWLLLLLLLVCLCAVWPGVNWFWLLSKRLWSAINGNDLCVQSVCDVPSRVRYEK